MQQVDEAVLFFSGSSLSFGLALETLIDAVCHLFLACLFGSFLILPCLPLPQVLLDPANISTYGSVAMIKSISPSLSFVQELHAAFGFDWVLTCAKGKGAPVHSLDQNPTVHIPVNASHIHACMHMHKPDTS